MEQPKKHSPFIEANTTEVTLGHLKNDCIIPTFAKDNEVCISHQNFIESVYEATKDFYHGEIINTPDIRTSHIVKGRIPEAINKRVDQLLESDKTMYYERMMFQHRNSKHSPRCKWKSTEPIHHRLQKLCER